MAAAAVLNVTKSEILGICDGHVTIIYQRTKFDAHILEKNHIQDDARRNLEFSTSAILGNPRMGSVHLQTKFGAML